MSETYKRLKKMEEERKKREHASEGATDEPPTLDAEWENVPPETEEDAPETRAGWKERLRNLLRQVPSEPGSDEALPKEPEGEESAKEFTWEDYLNERSAALDKTAEGYGKGVLDYMRRTGNWYNRLNWKKKVLIGVGLGLGAAATTGVSAAVSGAFMGGVYAQRVLGTCGMFVRLENFLENKKVPFHKNKMDRVFLAIAGAAWTSTVIGFTIREAVQLVSDTDAAEVVHEWLRHHWPFEGAGGVVGRSVVGDHHIEAVSTTTTAEQVTATSLSESPPLSVVPEASPEVVPPEHVVSPNPVDSPLGINLEHAAPASAEPLPEIPATSAIEVPDVSVSASKGHGYEYMTKRLWEQLQDKHISVDHVRAQFGENSDLYKLVTADDKTIDGVVHRIAMDPEHGFFNPDGTNVRIDPDAHLHIGTDGQLHFSDPTHPDIVQAPENAPTTPAYRPETPLESSETQSDAAMSGKPAWTEPDVIDDKKSVPFAKINLSPENPETEEILRTIEREHNLDTNHFELSVDGENLRVNDVHSGSADVPHTEIITEQDNFSATTETPLPPEDLSHVYDHAHAISPEHGPVEALSPDHSTVIPDSIVNRHGLEVVTSEPHVYADNGAKHLFVYGGSSEEQADAVGTFFKDPQNAHVVLYGTDAAGRYRIPYFLGPDGQVTVGAPVRSRGFLGFFKSFMQAPRPDELRNLIR